MEDESSARPQSQATDINADHGGQTSSSRHQPAIPMFQQGFETRQQHQQQQQRSGLPAGQSSLNMSTIAGALPDYSYQGQPSHVYAQQIPAHNTASNMMYNYPQAHYVGNPPQNFPVAFAQQPHLQTYQAQRLYGSYPPAPALSTQYPGQVFYPPNMMNQGQMQPQFQQYHQNSGYVATSVPGFPGQGGEQYQGGRTYGGGGSGGMMPTLQPHQQLETEGLKTGSNPSSQTTATLRGPPRKPKQSGYALWVGNLPPGTNILDLKDHFCRDATDDIESVFLISKSNCAFVNYKTEQSCAAAMNRFHDSRFLGVRLVCRLRRGSAPGPGSTTTPAGLTTTNTRENTAGNNTGDVSAELGERPEASQEDSTNRMVKERFFIIKSLTIEDLERSVQSGIWATQSHNEVALNKAYQTAENVYLIFSANKSGEYFGYARMDSAIDDEVANNVEFSPAEAPSTQQSQALVSSDLPTTVLTPATAFAPRGHIIDDSARGTIFWEAESVIREQEDTPGESIAYGTEQGDFLADDALDDSSESPSKATTPQSTTFGKPFNITWMSTDRLPFYRTRGLRNPWNTNREVKIARDGTELEPGVGRKLVDMFGTVSNTAGGRSYQQNQYLQQGSMPMPGPSQGPSYRPF